MKTFVTWMLAVGCLSLLVGCDSGPKQGTDQAAQDTMEATLNADTMASTTDQPQAETSGEAETEGAENP